MADEIGSGGKAAQALRVRRFPWLRLIIFLAVATLIVWSVKAYRSRTRFTISTCLRDGGGVQEQAPVRLAGVEVGYVKRVRPQPQEGSCPVRVEMAITAPYELKIPKDSVTSVETAGVLGPAFMQVDVTNPSGVPIEDGGTLPTREIVPGSTINWQKLLERWIDKCGQRSAVDDQGSDDSGTKHPTDRPNRRRETAK